MTSIQIKVPNWLDLIFAWPVLLYRKHKYGYPFRKIRLTGGKFAIVDPQNFYWLNSFDWCAKEYRGCFHAVRFNSHGTPMILSMHRQIMNPPHGLLVDHKNHDGLDNRRANLRLATYSQNNCNTTKRKNTSSQFVGVNFDKRRRTWLAYITHNGKRTYLGRFNSEVEAAKAYDNAALEYHKDFARLNFS